MELSSQSLPLFLESGSYLRRICNFVVSRPTFSLFLLALFFTVARSESPHRTDLSRSSVADSGIGFPRTINRHHNHSLPPNPSSRIVNSPAATTYDSALTPVGTWAWGPCMATDLGNNRAYIGNGRSLQILDITNPDAPVIIGEYVTSALIYDLRVRGDSTAFVCTWDGFLIIDVSNPAAPVQLSGIYLWGANRVIPMDSIAYVSSGGTISVVDITDLRNPYVRSQAAGDSGEGDRDELTLYNGRYLYLGDPEWPFLIQVYDCQNPDNIQELHNLNIYWQSLSVSEWSNLLVVGTTGTLKTYSLSDPTNPGLLGIDTIWAGYSIDAITVSEVTAEYPFNVAFAISHSQMLYTIDLNNPYQPVVVDSVSLLRSVGFQPVSFPLKIKGPLAIAAHNGVLFADARNPYAVQPKADFMTGGDGPIGVALQDHYLYLANGRGGVAILDNSNPTRPVKIGSLLCGGGEVDAVAISGGYLYAVGHFGLWTINVSNPTSPSLTSWIPMGNAGHPPFTIAVENNRAYVSVYDSSVVILDISNPATPSRIGSYPEHILSLNVRNSLLYLSGMSIIDVSNPQNIVQLSQLQIPSYCIAVDSIYAYNGGILDTGLTVVDISNPLQPGIVGAVGLPLGMSNADYITVSNKYVYISQSNGRVFAVDVNNPASPRFVGGSYPVSALDLTAQNRFVYLCETQNGLQVFENKLISHQQPFSFNPGWNMISVPSFPGGSSSGTRSSLFPSSSSSAFAYSLGYIAEDTLVQGKGYWLKFDAAQEIQIPDVPVYSETLAVAPGWNIVGSISIPVAVSEIGSMPDSMVTSQFFGLGASNGYQVADTISPGKGYWVRVNQSGSLVLPGKGVSGKAMSRIRIVPTSEQPPSQPVTGKRNNQSPVRLALEQNYPNPFNPSTRISYSIPHASDVSLIVYDLLGREVARLVQGTKPPGDYSVTWNAANVPSGVYYCRLVAGSFVETKKMVVMK